MGRGGDSTTKDYHTNVNKNFNQNLTGNNLSGLINLGTFTYGHNNSSNPTFSNSYTPSFSSSYNPKNSSETHQSSKGGEGGGFGLDLAASVGVGVGGGSGSAGSVDKTGGGVNQSKPIPSPKPQSTSMDSVLIYGGIAAGSLVLFKLIDRRKK